MSSVIVGFSFILVVILIYGIFKLFNRMMRKK